jgi:hypothetical protein
VGTDFGIYETYMDAGTRGAWDQLSLSGQTGYFGDFSSTMTAQVDPINGVERMYLESYSGEIVAFWASPAAPLSWSANWIPPAVSSDGAPVAANGSTWEGFDWVFTTDAANDVIAYVAVPGTGQLNWFLANQFGMFPSPPPPLY